MGADTETAFREAFELYADALYRHACYRLSDRERGYDLVQDTFLRAWDHVSKGKDVRNYQSFLYHILHNLIIDEYRRKKAGSLDAILEDDARAPAMEAMMAAGSVEESEESLDERALIAEVRSRMSELPIVHREILTMRYIDGLDVGEIAELLGVTENVVSVRTHRALAKLRDICTD